LYIIEVDGSPVIHPGFTGGVQDVNSGKAQSTVSTIRINVGQRYSVLVFPKENDQKSYWLRATMDDSVFPEPSPRNTSYAIVSYGIPSTPTSTPLVQKTISSIPCSNCIACTDLISLASDATNIPAYTRVDTINIEFNEDQKGINRPFLNGINCKLPSDTTYLNILRARVPYPRDDCLQYDIAYGEVVRLIFNNYDDGEHPIHLHGNRFWVLEEAAPDAGTYSQVKAKLNTVNPLYRDTVTINANSYLVIQFKADNPGIWLLHCHIEWHMSIGFMMIVNVAPDRTLAQYGPTPTLLKCSK